MANRRRGAAIPPCRPAQLRRGRRGRGGRRRDDRRTPSVARQLRRRGIGRALLEAAEAWARAAHVAKLELHVFPHNAAALALYEGRGRSGKAFVATPTVRV